MKPRPPHVVLHQHVWGMTHTTWSYLVWGFVLAVCFGVTEVLSKDVLGVAPWYSLSRTAWGLEALTKWVAIVLIAGLAVLVVHIVFGPDGPAG